MPQETKLMPANEIMALAMDCRERINRDARCNSDKDEIIFDTITNALESRTTPPTSPNWIKEASADIAFWTKGTILKESIQQILTKHAAGLVEKGIK